MYCIQNCLLMTVPEVNERFRQDQQSRHSKSLLSVDPCSSPSCPLLIWIVGLCYCLSLQTTQTSPSLGVIQGLGGAMKTFRLLVKKLLTLQLPYGISILNHFASLLRKTSSRDNLIFKVGFNKVWHGWSNRCSNI